MQGQRVAESVQYASLGWRFAGVLVDSVALFFGLFVMVSIAAAAGAIDVTAQAGTNPFTRTVPAWLYVATYGLVFVYYTAFEMLWSSSPGKLACGMRVMGADGSRVAPGAIVVRNLVRIPEIVFWYIPAGISCLATGKNQRLGDLAAHTVVVRRVRTVERPPVFVGEAPLVVPPIPGAAQPSAPAPAPAVTSLDASLMALKAAALTLRGAHHNYLHLSELEIARGGGVTAPFSPEYTSAWHTLADAVIALQRANGHAEDAARLEGLTLGAATAAHPDVLYLCRELAPYFTAGSDEQVHEAYLQVARSETA